MFSAKLLKLWIFKDLLVNTYQSIHTIQVPSILNVPHVSYMETVGVFYLLFKSDFALWFKIRIVVWC